MYVSEITRFLQELHVARPEIAADQAEGRALWWDKKPMSEEERAEVAESRVPQAGYVYQTKG